VDDSVEGGVHRVEKLNTQSRSTLLIPTSGVSVLCGGLVLEPNG